LRHTKPKRKIKTIIKQPIFNVIPYNLRSLDTFMTKLYNKSIKRINANTQTNQEVDLLEKELDTINLRIEQTEANPYE
jgi:hypothetical protein